MYLQQDNAFDAWKKALTLIAEQGYNVTDERNRTSTEILNMTVTITSTQGITLPVDYLSIQPSWVYPSLREIEDVMLARKKFAPYEYAYGKRIFGTDNGFDQINESIIPQLTKYATTRRACVFLLEANDNKPSISSALPSVFAIHFFVRDNQLHTTMYIRSLDMFIGWPANIYQLFVLAEYVASRIERPLGHLTTIASSAHIYDDYKEHIKKLTHS